MKPETAARTAVAGDLWWKRGVIYHVYPRSFQDSSGDGVGDLRGVTARLDYLSWLGVDAVWLSPIFPSPMADFGYDVSDFTAIDPAFGSLADFDKLVVEAHERGLRVILDYVLNHTSELHPWFLTSRSSKDDPRRDWYIWRDPAPGGGPPTNWLSVFGGSAWTLDERTGQYYYHAFLREQPDLNWRNPQVREAMHEVLRFWLDRGVDGFRVDALWHAIKDDQFRDNPPNPAYLPVQAPYYSLLPVHTSDLPEMFELVSGLRQVVDRYPERVLIGELYLPVERLVVYYGEKGGGVHLPFNFQLIKLPWKASALKAAVDRYEGLLPADAWPNWVLGNHDKSRIASRVGPAQARVAAMILLTLRGTPTLYYGDEIGMRDVPVPPDRVQDPFERNVPGRGFGRDPVRTPMPWEPGPGAGFTTGSPWLPMGEDAGRANVAAQRADPRSMLSLHQRLLALRRAEPALHLGTYGPLESKEDVFAFLRKEGRRTLLIALNLGSEPQAYPLGLLEGRVILSTGLDREGESVGGLLRLRGDEGAVVAVGAG